MKIKKITCLMMCMTLMCGALIGCGSSKSEDTASSSTSNSSDSSVSTVAESAEGEEKQVAYITPSTTTPFWNWVQAGVEVQAEEAGWSVQVYDSNNDSATQLKNAQNAITSEFDAIIISPTDSASCGAVLDEAEAAGIPVIICDIGTDEGEYLSMVSTPNYDGAKEVGEYLGKYLTDNGITSGSIGQITIPLSRINGQLRTEGFADGLAEYGFEVSTTLESSDFTVDEADSQARNIVTANEDLVAVFANHDQATLGAVSAIQDLNVGDKVVVAAFDGSADIVDMLKNGEVLVCGAQQAKKMGKESINALVSYFAGETVEKEISVPTFLLTADNVEEYLTVIDEDICGLN